MKSPLLTYLAEALGPIEPSCPQPLKDFTREEEGDAL